LESNTRQLSLPLSPPSRGERTASEASPTAEAGSASRLVGALAAFCREHPLGEKILVAPDRIVGRQLTDAVARLLAPGGWINLRVETVGTLAHSIVGPDLAAEGRRTLSRAQRVAVVEKICGEVLSDESYFGGLRRSPGFHRALSRTIDEIRASGIDPSAIAGRSLEDARKAADLAALLRAYEAELGRRFADGPGILRRAVAAIGRRAPQGGPWVLLPDRPSLAPAEMDLLRGFAGERLIVLATDDPGQAAAGASELRFRRAVGEENEIRDVFRRALAESIPFDQIEILYTDRSTYLPLAYELARQYDIPATFVDRIGVAYTRPGRAALGFLDWLRCDFGEHELRRLLTVGALDLPTLSGSRSLSGAGAARILRQARIGWGSSRYPVCLDALAETRRYRRKNGGEEEARDEEAAARRRDDLAAVRRLSGTLIEAAPVRALSDAVSLRDLSGACAAIVRDFARSVSEVDGIAKTAIPAVLDDLAFLESEPIPLREAASRIREAIADLFVGGSSVTYPKPGAVHFAGVSNGGYTGRPRTFVIGLDESRHPGAGLQDPVLLDGERRRINRAGARGELALRGDAPREKGEALRATLARLRGTVTLSFSCIDLSEDREQFPAGDLVDLFRAATRRPEADSAALAEAAGAPAGYFPEEGAFLDRSEGWLGALRASGHPAAGRGVVLSAHPWLAAGDTARTARRSSTFTAWDGAISSAGTSLDPRDSGEVMSASRLQTLADCPFSYFLRYVLRVEPPEEVSRDEGVWLAPVDLGGLLHEVFREFMEGEAAGVEGRSATERGERLERTAERAIERWRRAVPPPNPAALERQRLDVRRACETFLRSESRAGAGISPRHFEIGFGYPGASPDPVLGDTAAVEIAAGSVGAIRVRGSIDRVDRAEDGSYEIWDYKTGSAFSYDPTKGIDGGRRIQHAVYAAAFEDLLRRAGLSGRVARAGYIFTGPRSDGRREDFGWDPRELRATLGHLCEVLRDGAFLHGIDAKESCAFCPYESVCGGRFDAAEAAGRKAGDPRSRGLAALAALGWGSFS